MRTPAVLLAERAGIEATRPRRRIRAGGKKGVERLFGSRLAGDRGMFVIRVVVRFGGDPGFLLFAGRLEYLYLKGLVVFSAAVAHVLSPSAGWLPTIN